MYDPLDEETDETFRLLLRLLREVPEGMGRKVLSEILEETALLSVALREADPELAELDREELLGRYWDKVEEERNRRAAHLLHAIQKHEF